MLARTGQGPRLPRCASSMSLTSPPITGFSKISFDLPMRRKRPRPNVVLREIKRNTSKSPIERIYRGWERRYLGKLHPRSSATHARSRLATKKYSNPELE